ncbi:hypothetical protein RvY_12139-1 [Ramazzottius varieornatus]|uniref:Receptor ligand binding region domain-containing protein n=1 Tax=Ramazzottius varieornatus TaxID=947166 RepID=A0A1D1VIF6_RAMVA|nr:hypothetical protein RvY_12139-1 [Ramazzottius varieornatus]
MSATHVLLSAWSVAFITLLSLDGTATESRSQFSRLNITVGIYGISEPYILSSLPYVLPGFLGGLDYIGPRYNFQISATVLSGRHTVMVRDCIELAQYLYLVPQFYYSRPRDGSLFLLLHTGCNEIYDLSAMSLEWNTLVLSSAGPNTSGLSSLLRLFHNLISSSVVDFTQMIIVLQELLRYFSWSTIAIVRDKDTLYYSLVDVMTSLNENAKDKLTITVYNLHNITSMNDGLLLTEIKNHARIILLLMNAATVRGFLSKAHNASMTNGEYVYIFMEPYYNERRYGKLAWNINQADDLDVKEGFRSLLFVTSTCHGRHTGNKALMNKFKNESIVNYGGVYWEREEPINAFFMYKLVKLVGQILDGALQAGMNVHDGYSVADLFRERTFTVERSPMRTDKYNRVLFDYCVKDFNFEHGTWNTVCGRCVRVSRKD